MGYEVHTPIYEGPLELLLRLIEKEELDITQVALAQVTDEFLAHLEALRGHVELDVVAEFMVVAARLLWIKSRVLLPRPPQAVAESAEEGDEGDQLVQQLRTYRQFKEAAQTLRQRDTAGLHSYVQVGPPPRPQRLTLDLTGLTLAQLRTTAEALLYPGELPQPQAAVQRLRYSIVTQIRLVRERLLRQAQVMFHLLLSQAPTRLEKVVTLQAVLELIKQQAVAARQERLFGEILIAPLVAPETIADPSAPPPAAPALPPAHQSANP